MELLEKKIELPPRPLRLAFDQLVPEEVEAYAVCDDEMDEVIVYFLNKAA